MNLDLPSIFIIGFLSSFSHCYGMCGGFVMAYSLKANSTEEKVKRILPHLMYNLGRVITYAFLGALFGLLGASLQLFIHDAQSILFILAGLFMVGMGLDLAGWVSISIPGKIPGIATYKRIIGSLLGQITAKNMFLYGIVLGFIPCGLVYIAGAEATASGSVVNGILIMLSFGLGTIPALFILGMSAQYFSQRFRKIVFKVAAIFVILFGLFTIVKGGMKLGDIPMPWMKHDMQHTTIPLDSCCMPLPKMNAN
ncbi:MAG: sulfite exporter TauE/SafE family protein [Candidatus Marinimicrobia bacterium]|nr:sulfite exporter TauE/SafE family protein [Candidatus Neomarinimicrobiota bacterium]